MQPPARGPTKKGRDCTITLEDWSKSVRKPTVSGFYLILVALVWWGAHIFELHDGLHTVQDWEMMVDDVAWAVEFWMHAETTDTGSSSSSHNVDDNADADEETNENEDAESQEGEIPGLRGRGKPKTTTNRKRKGPTTSTTMTTTRKRRR